MMADFKQNEGDHIKELEYEIDELKAKLDKTEYIIQYKEKIWTYLEREIRKVVSADSELMRKIEEQTKILPDCLAQQKVSNIVKQKDYLQNDHSNGCTRLEKMIREMKQDLNNTDLNVPVALSIQNHKKYESLKIQKSVICAANDES